MEKLKDFVTLIDGLSVSNALDDKLSDEQINIEFSFRDGTYITYIMYRKSKVNENYKLESYAMQTPSDKDQGARQHLFNKIKKSLVNPKPVHATYGTKRDAMSFVVNEKEQLIQILGFLN